MPVADVHCHLGMYPDPVAVVRRAEAAGVAITVATARASEHRELRRLDSPNVTVGLGLHPELAGSVYVEHELEIFGECVAEARWISEVGLDGPIARSVSAYFGGTPSLAAQRDLLDAVIELGGPDRIYCVHSRGLARETIEHLAGRGVARAVLHNFDGTPGDAAAGVEAGFHFSLNAVMLDTAPGRAVVAALPADRLLLETDGPYYSWRGARVEPADCRDIAAAVAAVRAVEAAELEAQVSRNLDGLTATPRPAEVRA